MLLAALLLVQNQTTIPIRVYTDPAHRLATFAPAYAFGAGIDGHEQGHAAKTFQPANIKAMLSAGLNSLSYRLRTELGIEAWHWNTEGSWSDPLNKQGYWTSSSDPKTRNLISFGYKLPRRGSTIDQANNTGYSMVVDGDQDTFWKSNPYLDRHFTNVSNDRHPQFLVLDFGAPVLINAAKIHWGEPYAKRYKIEYWIGENDVDGAGKWQTFPTGDVQNGKGGFSSFTFGPTPSPIRFVRIRMFEGSMTAPAPTKDIRDKLGFAVKEVYFGAIKDGLFKDAVQHSTSHETQTLVYASSTDPWHRESDMDPQTEQPGFDLVFQSGLTNNLPTLLPVGCIYDTPENSAAEAAWLKAKGYPLRGIELGEEADGQCVNPVDYALLYIQHAAVIRKHLPKTLLGGPSLQTPESDYHAFPGEPLISWIDRFLAELKQNQKLSQFQFLSFEWYPFDEVKANTIQQIRDAPDLLRQAYLRFRNLPANIPRIISEYGYSAFAAQQEVELPGAIVNAESVAKFLSLGGRTAYLYGYDPDELIEEIPGVWGQNMMFMRDDNGAIKYKMPTYYAAAMVSKVWCQAGQKLHEIYFSEPVDQSGFVTSYAVKRPDGQWALLVFNKNFDHYVNVMPAIQTAKGSRTLRGPAQWTCYSVENYRWKPNMEKGMPTKDQPPTHKAFPKGIVSPISLPPYSISVIVGKVGA